MSIGSICHVPARARFLDKVWDPDREGSLLRCPFCPFLFYLANGCDWLYSDTCPNLVAWSDT